MISNSMMGLILQRIGLAMISLVGASLIIFAGTEVLPGDVAQAILGQSATPEAVANIRAELGLDVPAWQRYLNWIGAFASGDLGVSLTSGEPIGPMLSSRLGNTFFLAGVTALIAIPIAIGLGLLAAMYRNRWIDRLLSIGALSTVAVPEFLIAYLLIFLFAVTFPLAPVISNVHTSMDVLDRLYAIVLPSATLSLVVLAQMMRMTRASVINVMSQPYIEMATLKGIGQARIILRHAFPNALGPIITVVVLNLAYLVVGVVVVEVVFVYPGIGQLMVDHVAKRDVPMVQACGLIFAITYIALNMIADVLGVLSNPKLRHPK